MNNPNEICFFISCDILIMFQHSVYALCISSLYCSFSHIYETFFNVSSFPVEKPHCWQNIDCTSRVNWLRVPKPACNMCKELRSLSTTPCIYSYKPSSEQNDPIGTGYWRGSSLQPRVLWGGHVMIKLPSSFWVTTRSKGMIITDFVEFKFTNTYYMI